MFLCSFTLPHKGSGEISSSYLRHKTNSKYIFRPSESAIRVFVRARANDVSKAFFVLVDGAKERRLQMEEIGSTRGKQYFYLDLEYPFEEVEYYFAFEDGRASVKLNDDGDNFKYKIPPFTLKNHPEFDSLIWYQIDVDRFRNGDPYNEKNVYNWNDSWSDFSKYEEELKKLDKWYVLPFNRRYGGDLRGIVEQLDYLDDLGIDVVLLSPILYSNSNNKCDVIDHYYVSPDIGLLTQRGEAYGHATSSLKGAKEREIIKSRERVITESDAILAKLAEETHERGMKIVLEFPMHVGRDHFAFVDVMAKGRDSKYYDWFYFEESYESIDGYGLIPRLNHSNPEVQQYILESVRKLKGLGIDGLMINSDEENEMMQKIREIIFVIKMPLTDVEHFSEIENADSTINTRIFHDIVRVLNTRTMQGVSSLLATLNLDKLRYPISHGEVPAISTIDTGRAYSAIINMEESNNRYQENPDYKLIKPSLYDEKAKKKLFLALLLLSTYSGSMMLLYGDELGMWGAADPDSRKPMLWEDLTPFGKEHDDLNKYADKKGFLTDIDEVNERVYYTPEVDQEIKNTFKGLISMRRAHRELFSRGTLRIAKLPFELSESVLVYFREYKGSAAVIVMNISEKSVKLDLPLPKFGQYVDPIRKKTYDSIGRINDFEIEPLSSTILFLH